MVKILVVDDDDLVRNMICSFLSKSGYTVFEATNGNSGVAMAQEKSPDLVLTDMLMPDKEGIETIMEIKAINPDIKVIAMSGGGKTKNMAFLDMAKQIGAEHIMSKPFKPTALLEIIKTLV